MKSAGQEQNEPLDLRSVVEAIPAPVVCALPDSSVVLVNRAWQEYTGFWRQQSSESQWQSAIHPDDHAGFIAGRQNILSAGKLLEAEVRLRSADGRHRWFLVRQTNAILPAGKGRPSPGIFITFEDIEERKRAERGGEDIQEQWGGSLREQSHDVFHR